MNRKQGNGLLTILAISNLWKDGVSRPVSRVL